MLGLIWAQSVPRRGAPAIIGRDGTLPWHLPEDLAHFRAVTDGHPVIMGRRTWASLPPQFRPLPGRANIVLTTRAGWAAPGAEAVDSVAAARAVIVGGDAWVMGGAAVYAEFLPLADRIELTEVDVDLRPARPSDVPAPDPGLSWRRATLDWVVSRNGPRYRFVTLTR